MKVFNDKDATVAAGPEIAKVFKAADDARKMAKGSNVQDWNQATNLVITGKAGGQIMGDWAQGEFQVAGQVAGKDYTCLPGLGVNEIISTGGDAFYFPLLKDPEKSKAQEVLAAAMCRPEDAGRLQPEEGLAAGARRRRPRGRQRLHEEGSRDPREGQHVMPGTDQLLIAGHHRSRSNDLFAEFFANPSMTPEDAQKRFAEIIASAD